jgi:hypothetical protein
MSLAQRAAWLRIERDAAMRIARGCRAKGRPADWIGEHVARARRINREMVGLLAVLGRRAAA